MDHNSLLDSVIDFKEKKIDKFTLMSIFKESITEVLTKKYGTNEGFEIIVNFDKGDFEIWRNRLIVDDNELEDDLNQISLSKARETQSDFEVGEYFSEELKISDLGRRTIQSLKNILKNKIQEYDSTSIYKIFKSRIGSLITADVHHVRNNSIILLDDNQNEVILTKDEQIHSDYFRKGDSVTAIIKEIVTRGTYPIIKISRTSPEFLIKLFEQEIPEVLDGLIIIKKAVRIPGEKAKIAVTSYDDRIDPVGACIGIRGRRIHSIVRELRNENIDVINYSENNEIYIKRALSPAKVTSLKIDEENKKVDVFMEQKDVAKAVGKGGCNIKLAAELTGYHIDVYSTEGQEVNISNFTDIDGWIIDVFKNAGLYSVNNILELSIDEIEKRTDLERETIEWVKDIISK